MKLLYAGMAEITYEDIGKAIRLRMSCNLDLITIA